MVRFATPERPSAPAVRCSCERARILVVDDEHNVADSLALILRQSGYEVLVAYSGAEAVRSLSGFHPDLLLTDVAMPEINGIDAALVATQVCPNCHIVFLTAHIFAFLEDVPPLKLGFRVLAKPLHPLKLLIELAGILSPTLTAT